MSQIIDTLEYNTILEWDSLGHMSIIANIEKTFDIMMDTDDIIDMNTFGKAKEILKENKCSLGLTTKVNIADFNNNNKFTLPRLDTNDLPKDRNSNTNKWYLNA